VAEVKGTLLTDLCPAGRVRIVFQVGEGSGHEPIFTMKNLDAAEREFVRTLGYHQTAPLICGRNWNATRFSV
jgi:hypothetical protein